MRLRLKADPHHNLNGVQIMAAINATGLDDLIVVNFDGFGFAEYHGTRAMLEAEGVIPEDADWPQGYDDLFWEAGGLNFWLRRRRPPGAKGARRDFIAVDWFVLQIRQNRRSWDQIAIAKKKRELAEIIFKSSPQGIAAYNALWEAHSAARKDKGFQAFMKMLHIPQPKRRGRKPKAASAVAK
jgi:hypothetical protein